MSKVMTLTKLKHKEGDEVMELVDRLATENTVLKGRVRVLEFEKQVDEENIIKLVGEKKIVDMELNKEKTKNKELETINKNLKEKKQQGIPLEMKQILEREEQNLKKIYEQIDKDYDKIFFKR